MKYFKLFLAMGIMLLLSSTSWADIPNLINFQGILDSAGNPLANKTKSVEFKIYDDSVAGNVWWSETQTVTTNAGGVFNVILGSSNPIPDSAFDDTLRWLGIKVGTDAEMSPRQKLVSTAYGYRVSTVEGASGGNIYGDVSIQSDLTVSGNVGIGTASPLSPLHVYSTSFAPYIRFQHSSGGPFGLQLDNPLRSWYLVHGPGGSDRFAIYDGTASAERFTIASSGYVGIWNTNPNFVLDVNGTINATNFYKNGLPFSAQWGVSGSNIYYTGGNVGIGTSSPAERLTVGGSMEIGTGAGDYQHLRIGGGNSSGMLYGSYPRYGDGIHLGYNYYANAAGVPIVLNTGGPTSRLSLGYGYIGMYVGGVNVEPAALVLFVGGAGNVGIQTSNPTNILTVVQNSINDPIADAWTTYSSAEYKQGIHELTDEEYSEALQKLLATPVVKYRYKGQSFMDKEKIGIIIEEAPEEIVSEGNTKAASLNEYISLLHAAVKAQQTEIESLKQMLKLLQDEQSEK